MHTKLFKVFGVFFILFVIFGIGFYFFNRNNVGVNKLIVEERIVTMPGSDVSWSRASNKELKLSFRFPGDWYWSEVSEDSNIDFGVSLSNKKTMGEAESKDFKAVTNYYNSLCSFSINAYKENNSFDVGVYKKTFEANNFKKENVYIDIILAERFYVPGAEPNYYLFNKDGFNYVIEAENYDKTTECKSAIDAILGSINFAR